MILIGVVCLPRIVTCGRGPAARTTARAGHRRHVLVTVHGWTFVLGQSLMAVVNALLLGTLLYRSRLVPRVLPILGLIGAPLLFVAVAATIFGVWTQASPVAIDRRAPDRPVGVLARVWLIVKGFSPSPITAGLTAPDAPAHRDATT